MANSPSGFNSRSDVSDSALTLLAQPLDTQALARQSGYSKAWIKAHARQLGGHIVNGAWQFPPEAVSVAVERRTTTSEKLTFSGGVVPRASEAAVGERAAAVFQMLEERKSTSEIVRTLKEPPTFVSKMRAEWIAGYRADSEGMAFVCSCGAPSDPTTARCLPCHARSRILTTEQIAALSQIGK